MHKEKKREKARKKK